MTTNAKIISTKVPNCPVNLFYNITQPLRKSNLREYPTTKIFPLPADK